MPTLIKHRGKKRWRAKKMVHGQIRTELMPDATKKSYRMAIAAEDRMEEKMRNGPSEDMMATPSGSSLSNRKTTLYDWANEYMTFATAKFTSKKTIDEKRRVFERLFRFIDGRRPVEDATKGIFLKFYADEKKRRGGNQANRARKNLIAAWNWGMEYMDPALQAPNPCKTVRMPATEAPRYVPPEADLWKVIDACEDEQDRTLLLTFLHTAARRNELFRLRRQDLDFNENQIRLWTRKRSDGSWEWDWIPMTEELKSIMVHWMAQRLQHTDADPDHVFVCLDQHTLGAEYYGKPFKERRHFMARLCKKAGVPKFTYHAIRHYTASKLLRDGVKPEVIQKILRHKSITTTERYLHSFGIQNIRDAMEDSLTRPEAEVVELKKRKGA